MVDPKFGTKRVCEACGGKFYDLNKIPWFVRYAVTASN